MRSSSRPATARRALDPGLRPRGRRIRSDRRRAGHDRVHRRRAVGRHPHRAAPAPRPGLGGDTDAPGRLGRQLRLVAGRADGRGAAGRPDPGRIHDRERQSRAVAAAVTGPHERGPPHLRRRRLGRDPVRSGVVPGATFVNDVLAYFDQYALSHRLWAPDSSSFLLPAGRPGRDDPRRRLLPRRRRPGPARWRNRVLEPLGCPRSWSGLDASGRTCSPVMPLRCIAEIGGETMKAVVQDRYGPPEVLRIDDVERPVPKDDEVLIRVRATTVTQTDTHARRPDPFFWRLFVGPPPTAVADARRRAGRRGRSRRLGGVPVQGRRRGLRQPPGFGAHAEYICAPRERPRSRSSRPA